MPALDGSNPQAVAAFLDEMGAIPSHHPDWPECPDLEWHARWQSSPASVVNLDHLYVTRHGMIDIVPQLCGTRDELLADARPVRVAGHEVELADPRTILERMDGSRRKDPAREPQVVAVRTRVDAGLAPRPVLDWPT